MNCSLVYLEKNIAPLTLDLEISFELLASRTLIYLCCFQFSPVAQSCSTLCGPMDCSTPGFPELTDSCPLSWWCHSTISSSVVPFSCLQSFPASAGSFPMSQFFRSGGQNIGVSALASVLEMNVQDWFPLGWTGWISLQSWDSQESSPTPQFESINSLALSFLYGLTLTSIHEYWKNHSLDFVLF